MVAVLTAVSGCGEDPASPLSTLGPFTVQQTELDQPAASVDDVVAVDADTVVALISTEDHMASIAMVSQDAGQSWDAVPTGLAGHPALTEYVESTPTLHLAGDWLIATRPVDAGDRLGTVQSYSEDGGLTWHPLEVADPAAVTSVSSATVTQSGELLLAGYRAETPDAQTDAAFWRGSPATPLPPVAESSTTGIAEDQRIIQLVTFGGRLVASARDGREPGSSGLTGGEPLVTMVSDDNGESWSPLGGLPQHADIGVLTVQGDTLYLNAYMAELALSPGASSWTELPTVEFAGDGGGGLYQEADSLLLPSGSRVATMVDDVACDCSIAYVAVIAEASAYAQELDFDTCTDTSIRGDTSVAPPVLLGPVVLAVGDCSHLAKHVVTVSWSEDDGKSWTSGRLGDADPIDDVEAPHFDAVGHVALGDAVVLVGARDGRVVITRLTAG